MREILFKAKRLDNGEWVEGYYVERDGKFWIYPAGNQVISKSLARELRPFHSVKNTQRIMKEVFPVDPSTVCQYTGLTDGNGKRVFEGDVLKFRDEPNDYEWIGRVEFGNPNGSYTWGWQLVHISGPEPNIDTLCWFDMEEGGAYSEVIGSIHDGEGNNVQ